MAISQQDIDALDEAIVSGELSVKINGKEATYRSIGELKKARRFAVAQLKRAQGKGRSPLAGTTVIGSRGV